VLNPTESTPWYRQFWPWVLIALPGTVVIASLVTIGIALDQPDGLVVDDYYKEGLAINRVIARDEAAARYGMAAELTLRDDFGTLRLSGKPPREPRTLTLRVLHATMDGQDQIVQLVPTADGRFTAPIDRLGPGRWDIQIEADDWRLTGSVDRPGMETLNLGPAAPN
jgi:hypothetical protein